MSAGLLRHRIFAVCQQTSLVFHSLYCILSTRRSNHSFCVRSYRCQFLVTTVHYAIEPSCGFSQWIISLTTILWQPTQRLQRV